METPEKYFTRIYKTSGEEQSKVQKLMNKVFVSDKGITRVTVTTTCHSHCTIDIDIAATATATATPTPTARCETKTTMAVLAPSKE